MKRCGDLPRSQPPFDDCGTTGTREESEGDSNGMFALVIARGPVGGRSRSRSRSCLLVLSCSTSYLESFWMVVCAMEGVVGVVDEELPAGVWRGHRVLPVEGPDGGGRD
jgi:hypothetical protein